MSIDFTLAGAVIFTGLVVVFIALIGLWGIVALFGRFFSAASNKPKPSEPPKAAPAPAPKAAAPSAPAAPAPKAAPVPVVEDGIGDEIVAVIAAAVEAMGAGESGGYVLQSIQNAAPVVGTAPQRQQVKGGRPAWAQAGLMQNTQPF
ncbi:MAG: OadG family protein [Anaerotruncus sp.]|nr:OadG family protein [Anaerotruncus sp.]